MRSQISREKAHHLTVFSTIEANSHLLDLLAIATTPQSKAFFISALIKVLPGAFADHADQPDQLFIILTTWFGKYRRTHSDQLHAITSAFDIRQDRRLLHRNKKVNFIKEIGLNWDSATKQEFLSNIKVISLPRLQTPYPPKDHWVVESHAIDVQWREHIEMGKQPDVRQKRYPLFPVQPSQLQLDVGTDESILIYDSISGELVMAVIRNFCQHPDLLTCIDDIIKQSVESRKSIRVSNSSQYLIVSNSLLPA